MRTWWRSLPLMRVFACYVLGCVVATGACSLVALGAFYAVYVPVVRGAVQGHPVVEGGPYVYDARSGDLVPATQVTVGDVDMYLGVRDLAGIDEELGVSRQTVVAGGADEGRSVEYATMDMLRSDPALKVFDWGGNYTSEMFEEADGNPYEYFSDPVPVEGLAAYDAEQRATRLGDDEVGAVDAGLDVAASNVAYYVSQNDEAYGIPGLAMLLRVAAGMSPFVLFGVFSVAFFRRFYRTRLAAPLAALHAASDKIAEQDLDFTVAEVPGREFGRLAQAFERMRSSLAVAKETVWRTAEERKRLNAAFAHDLRTPLTVLKGTVEMARMHVCIGGQGADGASSPACPAGSAGENGGADAAALADGRRRAEEVLSTMAAQVDRLERYVDAMARASKLEDRELDLERIDFAGLARTVEEGCGFIVVASDRPIELTCEAAAECADASLQADVALVCEVVGNVVNNACAHAASCVRMAIGLDGDLLDISVADDGPGFSDEALHRGLEPFYSEEKSAEHFGMGLNIVQVLARLHGGDVALTNLCEPEQGGCVHVRFKARGWDFHE